MADNDFTISRFFKDSKTDISEVVDHFLEFFIDDDFIDSIGDFRNGLSEFQKSVDVMNSTFSNFTTENNTDSINTNNSNTLSRHGLNGTELIRKIKLFYTSRNSFLEIKQIFVNSFKEFFEKAREHTDERVEFEQLEPAIYETLNKTYKILQSILRKFRKITHRHFGIINILFKSIISVVDAGGLASEFKDSLEAVIKSTRIRILKKTIKIFTSAVLMERISY